MRGGYGIFWAPWTPGCEPATSNCQVGFTQNTLVRSITRAHREPDQPFQGGWCSRWGASLGAATGAGNHRYAISTDGPTGNSSGTQLSSRPIIVLFTYMVRAVISWPRAATTPRNINQLDPIPGDRRALNRRGESVFATRARRVATRRRSARKLLRTIHNYSMSRRPRHRGQNRYHAAVSSEQRMTPARRVRSVTYRI